VRNSLSGCEASVRFGVLLGRGHYQVGFHQTATAGAFGATLAAVLPTTPDQTVHAHALGLVTTRASGLKSQFGTDGKPFNAGMAAANGVEAALLAGRGFVSNPGAFGGENGFLSTHHADGVASSAPGFLMSDVSHKFHACCHGLHAALEALSELKPIHVAEVERIIVHTHPRWMSVCNQTAPTTGLGAKFSYRAVIALSLLGHDTAALGTYSGENAQNPDVIALRDKVNVVADDAVAETDALVEISTASGTQRASHDLTAPLSLADRSAKIKGKAAALVGASKAQNIWDVVHGPDDTPLDRFTTLMA
jgi:2-methylcitrate dehydratase PrpD